MSMSLYQCFALLLALACAVAPGMANTDGLREYKLFHGPCIGDSGSERHVGDVLVKHVSGKSRGKFQGAEEATAGAAKSCRPGSIMRSRLAGDEGREWTSSFVAVSNDTRLES